MTILYTIGYEGTDIDRFVETLKLVGVETLADIRAVPVSRKKGFSKTLLSARLQAEGLEYQHFVELGDPKPGRIAARDGRFEEFRTIYTTHMDLESTQNSLTNLSKVANERITCLMCFERDPQHCHRRLVAQALGFKVFDLYGDLPRRYIGYDTNRKSSHISQSVAAAE